MPKTIYLYYYGTDPNIQSYSISLPNDDDKTKPASSNMYDVIDLFDDKFIKVGKLTRNLQLPYIDDNSDGSGQYYQNIILDDGSISIVFNYYSPGSNNTFFPGGIPILFTYLYGSGSYFNKKISGFLLPYDNDVKSRVYIINVE